MRIFIVLLIVVLSGCSKGDLRTHEAEDYICDSGSRSDRSGFILSCIKNANPLSDEEPEDWIRQCQYMAEQTFCPKVIMIVTRRCDSNFGCHWREVSRDKK